MVADLFERNQAYFWNQQIPFNVKYVMEKRSGILLSRKDSVKLTYRGATTIAATTHTMELCFEAALPDRNLFSLSVETSGPSAWISSESLRRDATLAFAHWMAPLERCPADMPLPESSTHRYDQLAGESLALQAQAESIAEDQAPIAAVQSAILAALRNGYTIRSSDHCGTSKLSFEGTEYVREDCGDLPQIVRYPTDAAMLTCLRAYYDYESRSHCFPHRPAELIVWQYIQRQLRH